MWGKLIGGLLALTPTSMIAPFWLGSGLFLNLLARQRYVLPLYGHAMSLMALITALLEALLLAVALGLARLAASRSRG